jgi:Ulp1 family protease
MNSQSSPCVQIHHTGRDHWITPCQDTSGTIYVLDSMNSKSITTSVQIQMSRIYGKNKDIVPVKIHKVQQQANSVDCGVFAIAFMTKFCFSGWN